MSGGRLADRRLSAGIIRSAAAEDREGGTSCDGRVRMGGLRVGERSLLFRVLRHGGWRRAQGGRGERWRGKDKEEGYLKRWNKMRMRRMRRKKKKSLSVCKSACLLYRYPSLLMSVCLPVLKYISKYCRVVSET